MSGLGVWSLVVLAFPQFRGGGGVLRVLVV